MAIFQNNQRVNFHVIYQDRIPKTNLVTIEHLHGDYRGSDWTITVRRHIKLPKFYWTVDFGAVRCYWSDAYDKLHVDQLKTLLFSFIDDFIGACHLKDVEQKAKNNCNIPEDYAVRQSPDYGYRV